MLFSPIVIGIGLVAMLLLAFAANMTWLVAIFGGLAAMGLSSFIFGKNVKTGVILLVVGIAGVLLAPTITGWFASIGEGTTTTGTVGAATYSVTPAAITTGVSLSGNTFTVPITYNNTSSSIPTVNSTTVQFTIVRADTGTDDSTIPVSISVPAKITDPTTGLAYESISKDAMQKYRIYVGDLGDGSNIQDTGRTFAWKFGTTTSKQVNVTYTLNPSAFDYPNNYESVSSQINIAGTVYTVLFQKVNEVS